MVKDPWHSHATWNGNRVETACGSAGWRRARTSPTRRQPCCSSIGRDHSGASAWAPASVPLPAHLTSLGRAILASVRRERWLSLYPPDELPGRASSSIVRREELSAEPEQIAADGYATNAGESEADVGALGMDTVVGGTGQTAISVSAPSSRFDLGWSSGHFRTCAPGGTGECLRQLIRALALLIRRPPPLAAMLTAPEPERIDAILGPPAGGPEGRTASPFTVRRPCRHDGMTA